MGPTYFELKIEDVLYTQREFALSGSRFVRGASVEFHSSNLEFL